MKMWDSVVIVTDQVDFQFAVAIRGVLELFRLRVHLHLCPTSETMDAALSGDLPPAEHIIFCCLLPETPAAVLQKVALPHRFVIMLRHPGEFNVMAQAWLDAGCRAVVRPADEVDQDATVMFVLPFYYHLLDHHRPDRGEPLSEREAFERACRFDTKREGTGVFQMMERQR